MATAATMRDSADAAFAAGSVTVARFVALISPSETLTPPVMLYPTDPLAAKGSRFQPTEDGSLKCHHQALPSTRITQLKCPMFQ
jgi:hypothetical protein